MRLLLDTHLALRAVARVAKVSSRARQLIGDPDNQVFVSAATLWEIAIKHALSRGRPNDIQISSAQARVHFQDAGYQFLDISVEHAIAVENLPPLHSAPFDRILIVQALTEPLHLLTHDPKVAEYSNTIIEV